MTYTVVYKDYPAATLEEAAAEMLRDREVWRSTDGVYGFSRNPDVEHGYHGDYAMVEWSWDGSRLRVWFR